MLRPNQRINLRVDGTHLKLETIQPMIHAVGHVLAAGDLDPRAGFHTGERNTLELELLTVGEVSEL